MGTVVECDPVELTSRARAWLEGDPVLHNVVCTVLARVDGGPGPLPGGGLVRGGGGR
ncbi:MAG: hypothetical protein ACRD0O_08085 [Acidimicrobiia bacterium]